MRSFLVDLVFSVRVLRKSPVFSITVILVLPLAIGANSAVFSIIDAVLLRALPFRDPARLVMIWEKNPGFVADTHQISLEDAPRPEITKPMVDYTKLALAIRTNGVPESVISSVKSQIWTVDKNLPVFEVQTMEQVIDSSTSQRRFESFVMSMFGLFFGISPTDPMTYLEVALLMLSIAAIACALPAWRALRINPVDALHYE